MKSFSEFLNEHIVMGENSSSITYAIVSGEGKFLILTPPSAKKYKEVPYLVHGKFVPTDAFWNKLFTVLRTYTPNKPNDLDYDDYKNVERLINKFKPDLVDFKLSGVDDFPGKLTPDMIKFLEDQFHKKVEIGESLGNMVSTWWYRGPSPKTIEELIAKSANLKDDLYVWVYFTGLSHIMIDNQTKRIKVLEKTAENNTRMGTYHGGKTQYILPLSDYSIANETELVKVLKSLVAKFPYLKDYNLIDNMIAVPRAHKVADVLNGIGRIAEQAKHFDSRFNNTGAITVYHGTATSMYKDSISKYGLKPGLGPEYVDKISGHSDFLVYFSFSLPEVRKYAVRAGQGRGSTVLQVTIRDFTKMVFDEDNFMNGLRKMPENVMQEVKVRLLQLFPERDDVLQYHESKGLTIAENPLNPWGIKSLFALPNLTQSQKNALNLIGYYALKGTNTITFGYRGVIPPRDIKVIEQFKSTSTKDVDDKYEEKYAKVMTTFKTFHGNFK